MPVHFFYPPARVDELATSLEAFVGHLESSGEEIVGAREYALFTAIFTRRPSAPRKVTR